MRIFKVDYCGYYFESRIDPGSEHVLSSIIPFVQMRKSKADQTFEGMYVILSNITPLCNRPTGICILTGFQFGKNATGSANFPPYRLPLYVRSLFCFFQTYANDIYWVCKSRTGEATSSKNFTRYQGG